MLNATVEELAPGWDAIWNAAEEAEVAMLHIADCLRAERECVTLFDAPRLLTVLGRRENALEQFESGRAGRLRSLQRSWVMFELREEFPGDLPAALRGFASARGADVARLEDTASELEVLATVIQELHAMNRGLLEQAMTWVNMYVADLMGTSSRGTYDGSGRMRGAGGTVLRRTI